MQEKEQKKKYQIPRIESTSFNNKDVLASSAGEDMGGSEGIVEDIFWKR